jgi:flagellar basal-body rod modification protein FlgD
MTTSNVGAANEAGQSDATGGIAAATQGAVNSEVFLQLLIAQIKNQDPLNPTDSVQYVSQLAQFSELEQVLGMRDDLSRIAQTIAPSQ